jgi:hypothetical protein
MMELSDLFGRIPERHRLALTWFVDIRGREPGWATGLKAVQAAGKKRRAADSACAKDAEARIELVECMKGRPGVVQAKMP